MITDSLMEHCQDCKLLYLGYTGSRLLGTAGPESDHDLIGVYLAAPACYVGLRPKPKTVEKKIAKDNVLYDIKLYEFTTFIKHLLRGNPNLFPQLFVPEEATKLITAEWKQLLDIKADFFSKQYPLKAIKAATSIMHKVKESADGDEYDYKKAALVCSMLYEVLRFMYIRELVFPLPEAFTISGVKFGVWSFNAFVELGEQLISMASYAVKTTGLSDKPNWESVEELVQEIVGRWACKEGI